MRIKIIFSFLLLSLSFFSCNNNTNEVSRFYDDGRAKPIIAISSVVDSTSYELPWSLSEELTHLIKSDLSKHKNIFLASSDDVDASITNTDNPFSTDIGWMKDKFDNNEFVVFLELIKHNEEARPNATNLDMSMRLRIVDVKSKKPKIILQECINDKYYISIGSIKTDYQSTHWGSSEYIDSRMALAHTQLANEISKRIYDYIELSKSR